MTSIIPPSTASTHSPPTKFLYAAAVCVATGNPSSEKVYRTTLYRAGRGCCTPFIVACQPLSRVDRNDRDQDHEHRDDVHDWQLVGPRQVREDPDRECRVAA